MLSPASDSLIALKAEAEKRKAFCGTEGTLANRHEGLEEKPERGVRLSWALLWGTGARFHRNCLWSAKMPLRIIPLRTESEKHLSIGSHPPLAEGFPQEVMHVGIPNGLPLASHPRHWKAPG